MEALHLAVYLGLLRCNCSSCLALIDDDTWLVATDVYHQLGGFRHRLTFAAALARHVVYEEGSEPVLSMVRPDDKWRPEFQLFLAFVGPKVAEYLEGDLLWHPGDDVVLPALRCIPSLDIYEDHFLGSGHLQFNDFLCLEWAEEDQRKAKRCCRSKRVDDGCDTKNSNIQHW